VFEFTERQKAAQQVLAGPATHQMLYGGSRSGKTFLLTRNVVFRALKAPRSRHAILRFRFNAVKSSVVFDTFPRVMELAFPGIKADVSKTDWFAKLENGSEIWFGGLDDKERAEKILGMEFSTVYLNEASQIPWHSRNIALTRLSQRVDQQIEGREARPLLPRMLYDCNPPSKAHWTYRLFHDKCDPETREPLRNQEDYAWFQINPADNLANLSAGYLETLHGMSARMRARFLEGRWADATPGQLFPDEVIDTWRCTGDELPQLVRVVVAVDPSGSDDQDNADNDAIGIVVAGVGIDGAAYVLEDCTVKAGPATWGRVAASAYDRHRADIIVAEGNYGGAMVREVIKTAAPRAPFKMVTASRGKHVRAEPYSALYEQGKIRHAGSFTELEDELSGFSTVGYTGDRSPNRADALIWALAELFPGMTREKRAVKQVEQRAVIRNRESFLSL
jgi:phage terminase large subunit-like protein